MICIAKLSQKARQQIREDYQTGQFTRPELAAIHRVTRQTIDNVLKGVSKPFKYDAMNKAVSLDQLRSRGFDVADWSNEPLSLLTRPPQYGKVVSCPTVDCSYKGTADRLLVHLVKCHKRFDLEYLLEE